MKTQQELEYKLRITENNLHTVLELCFVAAERLRRVGDQETFHLLGQAAQSIVFMQGEEFGNLIESGKMPKSPQPCLICKGQAPFCPNCFETGIILQERETVV